MEKKYELTADGDRTNFGLMRAFLFSRVDLKKCATDFANRCTHWNHSFRDLEGEEHRDLRERYITAFTPLSV